MTGINDMGGLRRLAAAVVLRSMADEVVLRRKTAPYHVHGSFKAAGNDPAAIRRVKTGNKRNLQLRRENLEFLGSASEWHEILELDPATTVERARRITAAELHMAKYRGAA